MIYPAQDPVGYRELADLLREQITSGRLSPGQLLPSETTLTQTYGVARQTARAAVKKLRDEGLAELVRGHGVIVREQPQLEDVEVAAGSTVTARPARGDERQRLALNEGAWVLHVVGPDGSGDLYAADRYRLIVG